MEDRVTKLEHDNAELTQRLGRLEALVSRVCGDLSAITLSTAALLVATDGLRLDALGMDKDLDALYVKVATQFLREGCYEAETLS